MRELNVNEIEQVNGGSELSDNAKIALDTCGTGNVKSVSKDGFECK